MKKIFATLKKFFFPPRGSSRWVLLLPYGTLAILAVSLLVGGAYGWEYTNSPAFCGTTCHTMPPEFAAYQVSPHARIACVDCHIGREFVGKQIFRKAGDLRHVVATVFQTYEYPIRVKNMRPAPETCEKCHSPEKFSDDSLHVITKYNNDKENTSYSLYLILKTGGGSKREGLGRGIHWHIENPIYYYASGTEEQSIPFVSVVQPDGTTVDYVDVESGFDPASVDRSSLKQMDCITCHNRITHRIYTPTESMDSALSHNIISPAIPDIHAKGVEVLSVEYSTQEEALIAIAGLKGYYEVYYADFYAANTADVENAIAAIQKIYNDSVYVDQKVDWNSHPTNVGHIDSPGCFRCHDGKHLNADDQAIRLECNLCHSIPVVSGAEDFVTNIEISRGPEPGTHLNANWISLHNKAIDSTCSNCHTTEDMGGTSNTSFCSNSACHGNVYTFAGFDAPKLREILQPQIPTPAPSPGLPPAPDNPTFNSYIGALFASRCTTCHGDNPSKGLSFLTYSSTLKGGENGAVLIPGDSANSKLVIVQQSGKHFAVFTPEELALIIQWIEAGAPEK